MATYLGRTYLLYIPTQTPPKNVLLVVMHGGLGNVTSIHTKLAGLDQVAERNGWLVTYISGTDTAFVGQKTWNAGNGHFGIAGATNVDDVSYLSNFINFVMNSSIGNSSKLKHVYLVGFSNGAMLGYRYLVDRPGGVVKGLASIAGALLIEKFDAGKQKILQIHGVGDINIPLYGGFGDNYTETIDFRSWFDTRAKMSKYGAILKLNAIQNSTHSIEEMNAELANSNSSVEKLIEEFIVSIEFPKLNRSRNYGISLEIDYPVVASDIIYAGAAVGDNGSGYARPLVAGDKFLGFCTEKCDNSEGLEAAQNVKIAHRGYIQLLIEGVAITDIFKPVYASDDDTFTLTKTGNSKIGTIINFVSAGVALVEFKQHRVKNISGVTELTNNSGGAVSNTIAAATQPTTLTDNGTGTADYAVQDVADIALSTSNTYTDAAVNSAINTALHSTKNNFKEMTEIFSQQKELNAALINAIASLSEKINDLIYNRE